MLVWTQYRFFEKENVNSKQTVKNLNFEKIWIYLLLTWGHCSPWLIIGWSQVSNLSQATRSSLKIYPKSIIFQSQCIPSGGASLSGFLPRYSGYSRIVRTLSRIVRTIIFPGYTAWGSGFYRFFPLFTLTPSPLAQICPRGDFHLPTISFSLNREWRLSSSPETPGKSWIWSARAFLKVPRYFELHILHSLNVARVLVFPLVHCLLASLRNSQIQFHSNPMEKSTYL